MIVSVYKSRSSKETQNSLFAPPFTEQTLLRWRLLDLTLILFGIIGISPSRNSSSALKLVWKRRFVHFWRCRTRCKPRVYHFSLASPSDVGLRLSCRPAFVKRLACFSLRLHGNPKGHLQQKVRFPHFTSPLCRVSFPFLLWSAVAGGLIIIRESGEALWCVSLSDKENLRRRSRRADFSRHHGGGYFLIHLWPLPPRRSAKWIRRQISPFAFRLYIPPARARNTTERNPWCCTDFNWLQ